MLLVKGNHIMPNAGLVKGVLEMCTVQVGLFYLTFCFRVTNNLQKKKALKLLDVYIRHCLHKEFPLLHSATVIV